MVDLHSEHYDPWEDTLIENMIRARRDQGWSQAELARQLNQYGGPQFSQATVHQIESRMRPIRLNEAVVVAGVLNMGGLDAAITAPTLQGLRDRLALSVQFGQDKYNRTTAWLGQVQAKACGIADSLGSDASHYKEQGAFRSDFASDLYLDAIHLIRDWRMIAEAAAVATVDDDAVVCPGCGRRPAVRP